jgi:hypothetical protein
VTVATLLDRLALVKQTAPGRWLGRCPAHEDRSPSLSIRELEDGRVLLHCFGGCDTEAVLDSVGLSMAALFPKDLEAVRTGTGYRPSQSRIPAADILAAIDHEATVAWLIASDIARDRSITDEQLSRLTLAVGRIGAARDMAAPWRARRAN